MGEASFLSSQFADGEADVEKGPSAKEPGSGSNRGDSSSQHLTSLGVNGKTVQMNPRRRLKPPNSSG